MTDPVFFAPARTITAAEIGLLTGAELVTADLARVEIFQLAPLAGGGAGAIAFADGKRKPVEVAATRAAALLCVETLAAHAPAGVAVLVSKAPQRAFAQVGRLLFPQSDIPAPLSGETGVAPSAHIDVSAILEDGVIVEPGAVIGPGVSIGAGTIVAANAVVGANCRIGRDCYIGAGATVQYALLGNRVTLHPGARIGQDGFGFVPGPRGPEKMPQLGRVVLQDDVDIGANSAIDRGALDDTVIGEGTKIDNLVQIGHNCRIGRGCVIAGQSGISGSVTIGDFAMIGGGAGIADHVVIGAFAQIAARAGIMTDVPERARWAGFPAQPVRAHFREVAILRNLAKRKGKKSDLDE